MNANDLQAIVDELAIRRVLDEYCLRMEVNDFAAWMDLFTEDTVYEVHRSVLRGHKEVTDMLSQAPHGVHVGGAARITLKGDAAETIQNYFFAATSIDEWNVGWYFRTLVRTDLGWKIAHTKVVFGRKEKLPENERSRKVVYPVTA